MSISLLLAEYLPPRFFPRPAVEGGGRVPRVVVISGSLRGGGVRLGRRAEVVVMTRFCVGSPSAGGPVTLADPLPSHGRVLLQDFLYLWWLCL